MTETIEIMQTWMTPEFLDRADPKVIVDRLREVVEQGRQQAISRGLYTEFKDRITIRYAVEL
jgi:hypothetical protein